MMCGRYAFFTRWAAVKAKVGAKLADHQFVPRYNIPPGTFIPVISYSQEVSSPVLDQMWWGYKPHWAGDKAPQPINATIEKVSISGYFKQAYAHSRCVVPADGWYEWDRSVDPKQPHFICREDRELLWFAAISTARSDGKLGCAIITQPAQGDIKAVHDRMPLALDDESLEIWLDREFADPEMLRNVIRHIDTDMLTHWPVSPGINKPSGNGNAELLNPA
ncbi:MAG: SOS response-associated peptidase [Halomonas sp.]|nr:SOS response-associated peptidase [Halomonas sp.]